ncbi:tellurium resistance protein TerA [Paenibacillus sp. FSL H8-0548]|uniref:TerD family protein n=1 Tax=Paenibacillus sp. FSL H8-0548 TaxID=1920422 RepID=UPI00096CAC89|nr:TerD family protein [Paenibacillus sp. FSL H8-0548]OMF36870.1 tellurium resistance protein TerA [Paenibacillus sp. FSL H8-0548]
MELALLKGQKADITKNNPSLKSILIGMGWNSAAGIDIDFSSFLLRASGKVAGDSDLIFYSNPKDSSGSIELVGENKRNVAGKVDKEQVVVRLSEVPQAIERISFTLTIYDGEAKRQSFSNVNDAYIRIIDETTGREILRYEIGKNFSIETAIVVGDLYRYNGEWKFSAIGSGYSGGLAALCNSFGIEVKADAPTPSPAPAPSPAPVKAPIIPPKPPEPIIAEPKAAPVNLSKISLTKRGDVINLQKGAGALGEIVINLNWNQKKASTGFFGRSSAGVDLDVGCLYELKNGMKGSVQALGNSFGDFSRAPYVSLDGDDRTGSITTGENLRINGNKVSEIKRIVIYAYIYEGATNWAEAAGIVTIKQSGGPDIEVRMDEHNNRKGMCAIAMVENVGDQTFSIQRLVQYFSGHKELDEAYRWGLRWVQGSK